MAPESHAVESPLLSPRSQARQTAPSWPVVQPPEQSLQSCRAGLSAIGLGGCRLPIYIVLGVILFILLFLLAGPLSAVLGVLFMALGPPLAVIIVYLFFFSPPSELVWKGAVLLQVIRVSFYIPPKPSEWKVTDLKPKGKLSTALLQFAVAVRVPLLAEEELFAGGLFEALIRRVARLYEKDSPTRIGMESTLFRLVPVRSIKDMALFKEDEDPVRYVMDVLKDIYPKVLQDWPDKTSDRALTHLCVHGLGAHRIEAVANAAAHPGCAFVVRTNMLAGLPVKDGCEHFGNDAYFDRNFKVVKIVREEQVEPWEPGKFSTFFPDGSRQWEYAKFCFRSSLFALVTFVDHLYGIHLQVGNVTLQAAREHLSAEHPIRLFLLPFMYGTITINELARASLVVKDSWVPRAFPLDDEGLQLAWSVVSTLLPGGAELRKVVDPLQFVELAFDREKYIERKVKEGLSTTYYQQARSFFQIIKRFVKAYLSHYYGDGAQGDAAIAADDELTRFTLHTINGIQATSGSMPTGPMVHDPDHSLDWTALAAAKKREIITNLLTRYCDLCTVGHEQVGQVQAYAQDASFCAFSWPKTLRERGPIVAPKEVAMGQACIMALTSTPMPKLLVQRPEDNWSHLFPAKGPGDREKLNALFDSFQAELRSFAATCDEYNSKISQREFPNDFGMWTLNPKNLETSISI